MLHLPPLPESIRLLTDDESHRLDQVLETRMSRNPLVDCKTCSGDRKFRWWNYASVEEGYAERFEVADFECPCVDQWILSRYLAHCGIGKRYQMLGWNDLIIEGENDKKVEVAVRGYLSEAAANIRAGRGFILHGDPGNGKTLLSQLALKFLVSEGVAGYTVTFAEALSKLMESWDDAEQRRWYRRRIKNAEVLVIDDIGKEHHKRRLVMPGMQADTGLATGWHDESTATAQSGLDDLIRHRVASALPTIITTNIHPEEGLRSQYGGYGVGIVSLLSECSTPYHLTGVDYRPRVWDRDRSEEALHLTRPVVLS